ncbi:HAD family hydrolase [Candidatus Roizmanbacteria bacterium]|nr:HAD family hydrolase [Candidatus Roizmanbacteria bacterium]
MKYTTLIFDFDGTLADTKTSILTTVKKTQEVMNLKSANETEIVKRIGLPLKTTFEELYGLTSTELDTAITLYRSMYDEVALKTVTLFPEVYKTLQVFHNKGIKLTVASSKGKQSLVKLLENLEVSEMISYIAGEQDVENKKPAPDLVFHILKTIKDDSANTLVIGDTKYDIQMGRSAGCSTCGVTYGNGTKQELETASSTYVIDTFEKLRDIVMD